MQKVYANFQQTDSVKELFSKYKDAFGILFKDGSRYLCDNDYDILIERLSKDAQWNTPCNLNPFDKSKFDRNPNTNKRYFYRCFGIYLREASFRYAGDFADAGAFWSNLQDGVMQDLQKTYQNHPQYNNIKREKDRGACFWMGTARSIQDELTQGGDNCILRQIYRYFDNENIKIIEEVDPKYVRHLVKLAGCPLNFNPIRNRYDELRQDRTRNAIENRVAQEGGNTLNYSKQLRPLLVGRICGFFDTLAGVQTQEEARQEMCRWSEICDDDHYFYQWVNQEFSQHSERLVRNRINNQNTAIFDNISFEITFNTINEKVSVIYPNKESVSAFLDSNECSRRESYCIKDNNGNELFRIAEYGNIQNNPENATNIKTNLSKIFSVQIIKIVCEQDGTEKITENPWLRKERAFLFNGKGKPSNNITINSKNFLVLFEEDSIQSIEGGQFDQIDNEWNVYCINVDEDSKEVRVNTHLFNFCYDVQDPRYLHLYQDHSQRRNVFVHQEPRVKFGIGCVEFSNLPDNINHNDWIKSLQLECDRQYPGSIRCSITSKRHVKLENISSNPVIISEKETDEVILPKIILLPALWKLWVAKDENGRFNAYLKLSDGSLLDNLHWQLWRDNIYQYRVDNYENWRNSGYPLKFVANDNTTINAKCPYFVHENVAGNWKTTHFFLSNNPFDDVILEGGKYFFSWVENNVSFKAEIDYDREIDGAPISVYRCLKAFSLLGNIPRLTFGWSYSGTRFVEEFEQSHNYREPRRPAHVYMRSDAERAEWLWRLVERNANTETIKQITTQLLTEYGFDHEIVEEKSFFNSFVDEDDIRQFVAYLESNRIHEEIENRRLQEEAERRRLEELANLPSVQQWKEDYSTITDGLECKLEVILDSFDPPHNPDCDYNDEVKRKCYALAMKALLRIKLERLKEQLDLVSFATKLQNLIDADEDLINEVGYLLSLPDGDRPCVDYLNEWIKTNRPSIKECFKGDVQWWNNWLLGFPIENIAGQYDETRASTHLLQILLE